MLEACDRAIFVKGTETIVLKMAILNYSEIGS